MKLEKYQATLLGCAVGDALGMPVEGWKREHIQKYVGKINKFIDPVIVKSGSKIVERDEFGPIKYWTKDFRKGEYTDDTFLTIAIAETLVSAGLDINVAAQNHLKLYEKEHHRGFGQTTRDAFENLKNGVDPKYSGVIGGPGNAPAMKSSPIGLYMDATMRYNEGMKFAEAVARMTHLDPRSVVSGILQPHAVYSLLNGCSRGDFLEGLSSFCVQHEGDLFADEYKLQDAGNITPRMMWVARNSRASLEDAYKTLGNSSLVTESYPFAIFMFQKYWDSPQEGLIETVNFGGDCDTTGAIYGALAGAKNGISFVEPWISELKRSSHLAELGKKLYMIGGSRHEHQ